MHPSTILLSSSVGKRCGCKKTPGNQFAQVLRNPLASVPHFEMVIIKVSNDNAIFWLFSKIFASFTVHLKLTLHE